MLVIDMVISLANIMLILGALNATLSTVDAISSSSSTSISSINTAKRHELKVMQDYAILKKSEGVSKAGTDFLNIRHGRSKQRRHPTTEKEQQPQPYSLRTLHEARPEENDRMYSHEEPTDEKPTTAALYGAGALEDTHQQISLLTALEMRKFAHNFLPTESINGINAGLANATDINRTSNAVKAATRPNAVHTIAHASNMSNIMQATEATAHHFTSSSPVVTGTFKVVAHKIRKLHKKKIVESLRQLNNVQFNANGGQLGKSHHRSLLEAEYLQLQQTHFKEAHQVVRTADGIGAPTTAAPRANGNSSSLIVAQTSQGNAENVARNVDVNGGGLARIGATHGAPEDEGDNDKDEDENEVEDADAEGDTDDDLSNAFYQNDENNSNGGIDGAVDVYGDDATDGDIDELHASTVKPPMEDKFDQRFKNFSSIFIKDVDNNVDLVDNGTEADVPVADWQQKKASKVAFFHLPNTSKALTYRNTLSIANHSMEDFLLSRSSSEEQFPEPLLSASTSHGQQGYIAFSNSSNRPLSDVVSSRELIRDEPITDQTSNDVSDEANNFSLSELNGPDADIDAETETEGPFEATDDDSNHFLEGVVDAANSEEIYDWDEISRSNRRDLMHGRDVVTKFLQIVETQHSLGSNCEAGTSLNLGEGVVDRYAQDRFRVEAEVAVNRANMLTRIFKMTSVAAQADINLLHASVLSMVEFDDDIFAAGNCFDWNEHPSQPGLFCPFAYRLPPPDLGAILAKDLAMEYHYLGNTSEWFFQARKNAEKVIAHNEQYLKAFHLYSNKTDERIEDDTLAVKYEDGRWSKPYYDCGGGNIWMLTYTVPFFGYENSTYHFKGTSGIDIDLRRVDIDQCPQRNILGSTKPLNIFAGTDKCKQRTTMCEAIQGLGFRRGSYKCVCRKGYYFPDTTSQHKYFNGSLLEEEYEKLMLGKNSTYNIINEYECLPCAEGCEFCEDGSPCIAALNWPMRTSILALACVVIGLLPPAAWFTFRYQQVKVVRAASPALLRMIALGAFFIYCTNIVMYPNPNLYTCTARIWLREIGFSLTYGALMLKTWRISVIFRVRSAKAIKITDVALLKRLGCICGAIGTCLLVRTLVSPPDVVVGRTADDLKAFLCETDWWDYTFTSMEVVFLAWGVRLCIMVRKAPSEFNESRFISMAIYNEFLLTCFLNVSMLFLQSPANPDLLYIIFFCHTQLTITLLLALIFGSKVYIVLRSGKSHQESISMGGQATGTKFNFRPQVRSFATPSLVTTSTAAVPLNTSAENKLSDQEALEKITQLSMQLQRIQEMAPPKGVAAMTISSLLEGLKAPTGVVMSTAAASTTPGPTSGTAGNQLIGNVQRPEPLPLLSLSTEMQKYQQQMLAAKNMQATATNNNIAIMRSSEGRVGTSISSKDPTAIARREQLAVNTEREEDSAVEEKLQLQLEQQLYEHIVCHRCYEKCKSRQHHKKSSAHVDKCKMLGSPQEEGSISFKNIKLDCMCSQSDDLDRLSDHEQQQHTMRRVTKRTAATNTPPSRARRRPADADNEDNVKGLSSVSLPGDASHGRSPHQPLSKVMTQPHGQTKQQICDNCRSKFKRKAESFGQAERKSRQQQQHHHHKKLSRLSSKCNKLLSDLEASRGTRLVTKTTTFQDTSTQPHDCDEETQYSTDDIIFYTTTDTSDEDDDDDDDLTEDGENAKREDDLSSILSQSKSDTRVPLKLESRLATIELKCISLSLGNITTSSASSTTQPESGKSKNALSESNTTTIQLTTSTAEPAAPQTHLQTQTQPQSTSDSTTGSNNGKAKRPDKLVLNLNDRSKFTKEVSV